MLTENDVVQAVADYLRGKGYRIEQLHSTRQRGVDIKATNLQTGREIHVEAKGGTSSKEGTRRHGSPFTRNQARSHISVALYAAAKMYEGVADGNPEIAVAFPDDDQHRDLLAKISKALHALGIKVFLVGGDLEVTRFDSPTQHMTPADADSRRG